MKFLYRCKIWHKRYTPVQNEFSYSGIYIKFPLSQLKEIENRFFSVDRFNILSFFRKDHGARDGSDLEEWAKKILDKSGYKDFNGEIILQTFPRVLGYVFNPVSFWYCYEGNELKAIICEVNNTFGESHNYVIFNHKSPVVLEKNFHVSPFFKREGSYSFDFRKEDSVVINYYSEDEIQLTTLLQGSAVRSDSRGVLREFLANPLFTINVVIFIHWQALRLFLKKVKFYTKPLKKEQDITHESIE